jgi:hypothetical protein
MNVHNLKHDNDELFDLEYLARAEPPAERGQVLGFPGQTPGISVDEKLYQRFGEEFEAPAYENLAVEEDYTPIKEVLER